MTEGLHFFQAGDDDCPPLVCIELRIPPLAAQLASFMLFLFAFLLGKLQSSTPERVSEGMKWSWVSKTFRRLVPVGVQVQYMASSAVISASLL